MTDILKHLDLNSVDGTQLNLDALYQIAPSVFTEVRDDKTGEISRKVNFEVLRQLLGDNATDGDGEMYQFTWVGKNAARTEAAKPTDKTLRPVLEDSVDWDNTKNIYIEGDNLEVLKLLQRSYMGKVKMIYIDPPYNTGNDFVYHDDFTRTASEEDFQAGNVDELGYRFRKNTDTNGKFHSDWCSMIYSRLLVARSLLTEDGVVFISIDDNEVNNLHKICDEIFGYSNRINTICINMNSLSGVKMTHVIKGKRFPAQKEYLLIYKKGGVQPILSIEKKPKDKWDKEYNMIIPELSDNQFESFSEMTDEEMNNILKKMHLISLAEYAKTNNIELSDEWKFTNSYRIFGTKSNRSLAKKVANQTFGQQILGYTNTDDNKRFFRTDYNENTKDPRIELVQAKSTLEVFISDNWVDISNDGGVAQEGDVIYPNGKKPLQLINRIIKTSNSKEGIVLDFFSGSATTAHSVFLQNVIDGGTRRFIMVQLPENLDDTLQRASGDDKDDVQSLIDFCDSINRPHNICELGKERIRRAGKKIKEDSSLTTQNLDTGFRVYRLDESNYENVSLSPKEYKQDQLDLFANNIRRDRTDLDLLYGSMLAWGVRLDLPLQTETVDGCTIYIVNDGDLVACFSPDITDKVVAAMADKSPLRVLFRDACFKEDAQKINIYEQFKQALDWADNDAFNNIRVI
ncbi:site-specific DNA-methyltransferase [Barnesiella propionica]|uniref:site-specific DNA-methyltransferase n=1 Tax=Barnesiella propionica TaxID=2981781 RepID=UPI0021CEF989|nr:site-specific DNA-methyltransferase [Barnesiella propionica]MCU6767897.1 site-specific DNA-methyltransferase [Barnesiella propionica]